MACKTEANGRGETECMREGRKVTRCAASVYVLLPGVYAPETVFGPADGQECWKRFSTDNAQRGGYENELPGGIQVALGMS